MNKKEVTYLVLAAIIFTVTGIIFYQRLVPKEEAVQVEVVMPIEASFKEEALQKLGDPKVAKDNYQQIDPLTSGIGSTKPFGPF